MSEVLAETSPVIDLQEQVGDLDMWEQSVPAPGLNGRPPATGAL
jgi:hypothetical protein